MQFSQLVTELVSPHTSVKNKLAETYSFLGEIIHHNDIQSVNTSDYFYIPVIMQLNTVFFDKSSERCIQVIVNTRVITSPEDKQ